ncbi:probable protein phosphatase 2C 39 isoform X2 [Fagus crenata]
MEDYVVAQFKPVDEHELGLFAIFDGHLSHDVPDYLRSHLFDNILEDDFWTEPEKAVRRAYRITDTKILEKAVDFGKALVVANVGDSRAVICKNGVAKQLSVYHEPSVERECIEERGGFVSNFPGDVPRVDGQLAVARAFGDKSLKKHLSSEPDKSVEFIENDTEFVILASDGLWKELFHGDEEPDIDLQERVRVPASSSLASKSFAGGSGGGPVIKSVKASLLHLNRSYATLSTEDPGNSRVVVILRSEMSIQYKQFSVIDFLMRVYGALMWSLKKVLNTPEVMRVYIRLSILMISLLPLHGKGKVSEWNFTLHELQLCFGVKEFLVIAPQSASGVVLDAPEAF